VRIARPQPRLNTSARLIAASGLGFVLIVIGGLWFASRPAPFPLANERVIFHHIGIDFTVFRYADDPLILVIDCPSLRAQGLMFDRVAALIEKADAPKDQILPMPAFKAKLVAAGLTIGTYYYGDDYPAKALRRFFRVADADHITLTAEEHHLHAIAQRSGFLKPGANGAIISIPQAGQHHRVGLKARAVILRHELSHGAYFTIPAYHAFVHHFYDTALTAPEQAAFKAFLVHQGYDGNDHGLIVNETLAYLIFTRDPDFFRADVVGMTPARVTALRSMFVAMMPDIWLKRLAGAPLPTR
jgi:hypothetical protein